MRLCASIAVTGVKELKKLEPVVKLLENTPIELNLTKLVQSPDFEKFIPLLAVELEDFFGENVDYIRVNLPPEPGLIERLLTLIDYLNVERLVLKKPETTDQMYDTIDEAARYGVKVIWKFRKIESIDQLHEIANEIAPYRLRIAIDVASRRSTRDFARCIIGAGGYINVTYFDNKDGATRGLPIFDDRGRINYVKIFKILTCIRYEGDIVLAYKPEFYGRYRSDIDMAYAVIHSVGSQAIDDRTRRFVESLMREMTGWSTSDLLSILGSGRGRAETSEEK